MRELEGKVALVTGAGTGIGRACAVTLGRLGARVAVHYRRHDAGAEAVVRDLVDAGGDAAAFGGDLTKRDNVEALVARTEERFGGIDVLVNNAGDLVERSPLLEMPDTLWRTILDVNVTSTFLMCQAAAKGMVARRSGVIVNMGSVAAWTGGAAGGFAYATAKGAIVSLSKALAKELAPHAVRVNCVSPGLIGGTEFHDRFTTAEAFAATAAGVPLGRAGTSDDVASVVAFLAGPSSAYLTGETIEINGGMLMR